MLLFDRPELHRYVEEQSQLELDRVLALLTNDQPSWTIDMAFYALSGGCIYRSKYIRGKTLRAEAVSYLLRHDPKSLLPLQKAVLQDPSKADGITKIITCLQASWFCLQCFSRLAQGMAMSLLELNTWAHCVCTLFIYFFWWHKPYDVRIHALIESSALDHAFLIERAKTASAQQPWRNMPRQVVVAIEEPKRNGATVRVTTGVAWANGQIYAHQAHDRKGLHLIKNGESLPCTGFILVHHGKDSLAVYVSTDLLHCWQELWRLRVDNGFCNLPEGLTLLMRDSLQWCPRRVRNMDFDGIVGHISTPDFGPAVMAVMILAFAFYGGLHLFAWSYSFGTRTEGILWKASSVLANSSGLLMILLRWTDRMDQQSRFNSHTTVSNAVLLCLAMLFLLIIFNFTGRAYLVIESFIALPNSPASVYHMPVWTDYFPHI
jgi:hypothetical protein